MPAHTTLFGHTINLFSLSFFQVNRLAQLLVTLSFQTLLMAALHTTNTLTQLVSRGQHRAPVLGGLCLTLLVVLVSMSMV